MKSKFKFFLTTLGFLQLFFFQIAYSAFFKDLPTIVKNPDGTEISCFATGDEFFNYLHDSNGFTIIQGSDGFYYYATSVGDSIFATSYKVNSVDPTSVGLMKNIVISTEEYQKRVEGFWKKVEDKKGRAPHIGVINNLVVYIRFSDDTEFDIPRSEYDLLFNPTNTISMKNYFNEVSYGLLNIESFHYPTSDMSVNISYQDANPRGYYEPYNQTTNPIGYTGGNHGTQRTIREHTLLMNAINFISSQVPSNLVIDTDNDGYVDNVCFIIRGTSGAWADLLWAHRWVLYSFNVTIHGKRVYDYTFQPENQTNVSTLCHEMFHTLGAPDLYRYSGDGYNPVGPWDLMAGGFVHMGAHMKWKYTNGAWLSSIPLINQPGTYTLNPLGSSTQSAFRINSNYSSTEYFVLEYRKRDGFYENNLPNSGLLVYRINTNAGNGNASAPPDEVYVYRPGGTNSQNGSINLAPLSLNSGRTAMNDFTDPSSFLSNGAAGGLVISDVSSIDETISFTLGPSNQHFVILSANPQNAGVVFDNTNSAPYSEGEEVTVSAQAISGYKFINWTNSNGVLVSTNANYSFYMPNENVSLVANFILLPKHQVTFNVSDINGSPIENASITIIKNLNNIKIERIIESNSSIIESFNQDIIDSPIAISSGTRKIFNQNLSKTGQWIHWDNGFNHTSVGTNTEAQFDIASRWLPNDLNEYNGKKITKIGFFPNEVECEYSLKIWVGNQPIEVYSQPIESIVPHEWNTVVLNESFLINSDIETWFGVGINTIQGYPAGTDEGPAVAGKGDLIKWGGEWYSMNDAWGLNLNWNLQAFVEDSETIILNTNEIGVAQVELVEGEYSFTILKEGYIESSDVFTVDDDNIVINTSLTPDTEYFSVTFNLDLSNFSQCFNPILDTIFITGSMFGWLTPGSNPQLQELERIENTFIWTKTLYLQAGSYEYKYFINSDWIGVECPTSSNRVCNINEDYIINDFWGCGSYKSVFFNVFNQNNEPINDAIVTLGNLTNYAGNYTFTCIETGNYPFSVVYSGYETYFGEIEMIDDDIQIDVFLETQKFLVTFNVDIPFARCLFSIENDTVFLTGSMFNWAMPGTDITNQMMQRTGETNIWTKSLLLEQGAYEFKYFINSGWAGGEWDGDPNRNIYVTDNSIQNDLWLDTEYYTVTFVVYNENLEPLSNAIITLNEITNEPGSYVFNCIPIGSYPVTIFLDGYQVFSTNIEVFSQVEIDIHLVPLLDYKFSEQIYPLIFPNPFNEQFNILNTEDIIKVEVLSALGLVLKTFSLSRNSSIVIDASDLQSGLYFVRLVTNKQEISVKKILKEQQ